MLARHPAAARPARRSARRRHCVRMRGRVLVVFRHVPTPFSAPQRHKHLTDERADEHEELVEAQSVNAKPLAPHRLDEAGEVDVGNL